ncbi:MAG: substrate-binding domain-containing protein [Bacteroidales bacterium]|jgi:LacI family transcriptional regulator|nr:substrate-binding domain-containing protein [Bacteroidales bacterium]
MQQKIRIKDIAEMAGISPGTVDRILHNRGNVSESARIAVEDILQKVNYRPNIHITGLSLKRKYKVVITTPNLMEGEYWESIHLGIQHALEEFENIRVECIILTYNQYDIYSCRDVYEEIAGMESDAVIIGTTFKEETLRLSKHLDEKDIPYVFVDSTVENTLPLAFFTSDHYICGFLIAKLITSIIPDGSEIGMLQAVRTGDESANTSILRKRGFSDYLTQKNIDNNVRKMPFTAMDPVQYDEQLDRFFQDHHEIGGVVVLNSRGGILADYFYRKGIRDIRLVCVDLTTPNVWGLRNGFIDFLIGQEPEHQGFLAMKTLIEYLIYRNPVKLQNYVRLDILTRETIDYYKRFNFMN